MLKNIDMVSDHLVVIDTKESADTMLMRSTPDSKVYGASMWLTWGRQDPGGPQVGPMWATWALLSGTLYRTSDLDSLD